MMLMGNLRRYNNEQQLLIMAVKKALLPFNIMTNGNSLGHGISLRKTFIFRLISQTYQDSKTAKSTRPRILYFFSAGTFFIRERSGNFEKGCL